MLESTFFLYIQHQTISLDRLAEQVSDHMPTRWVTRYFDFLAGSNALSELLIKALITGSLKFLMSLVAIKSLFSIYAPT